MTAAPAVTPKAPVIEQPVVSGTPRSSITGASPARFIPSNWKTPRTDIQLPPTPPFDMGNDDEEFPKVSVKELINTFENVQHKEKVHVKAIDRLVKESSSESEVSTEGKRTFPRDLNLSTRLLSQAVVIVVVCWFGLQLNPLLLFPQRFLLLLFPTPYMDP